MKKKTKLLALMMALVLVLSLTVFVACNNVTEPPHETVTTDNDVKATEGLLISNSDFKVVSTSSSNYPRSITGWTGASMYSSGSFPTNVIAGAIPLDEETYNANKSAWHDEDGAIYNLIKSRYSDAEDAVNNVLMIHMPSAADKDANGVSYGPTAYGYTSTSFSLGAGKYYKLSVDVLTHDVAGEIKDDAPVAGKEPGARIYISTNAYAEYAAIDTDDAWKTYTFYIEGAATTATSLSLQLGLGKYSADYQDGLTSGYVFFDNVQLEELANVNDYTAAVNAELANENDYRKQNQTLSIKVPNGRFEFGATTLGTSAAASNWSVVTGEGASKKGVRNGIIDVTDFANDYKKYSQTFYQYVADNRAAIVNPAERLAHGDIMANITNLGNVVGTRVYMLSQQKMTATGLKSSKQLVVEKGKYYAISVNVYTFDISGAGVTLTLSGDGEDISIKGITASPFGSDVKPNDGLYPENAAGTNGGWTTYTFFIEGNQYKDTSYNMTLWLGTGSTTDNTVHTYREYESEVSYNDGQVTYLANGTFSTGWAFFDEVKLAEITKADWSAKGAITGNETDATLTGFNNCAVVSLTTENLFDGLIDLSIDAVNNPATYDDGTMGTPNGFSAAALLDKIGTDKTLPAIDVTAGLVDISKDSTAFTDLGVSNPGTPYAIETERAIMFKSNMNTGSYFLFDSPSFNVEKNSNYRISMWIKTQGVKSTSGMYVYLLDDEDATKASFTLINTSTYTDDEEEESEWKEYTFYVRGNDQADSSLKLRFTFGTGTKWTSATLANGVAFVSNVSMSAVEYTDFNNVTTGAQVKSVTLATSASTNATFTNGNFNSYDYSKTEGLDGMNANGNKVYGMLENNDYAGYPTGWALSDTTETADFVAGILKLEQQNDNANFYNSSYQIRHLFGDEIAAKFDNLYGNEDDTYFANDVERLGAPYVLTIAGLNENKFSRFYTSNSFSLSAKEYYALNVWTKAIGTTTYSIYLVGGSSGNFSNPASFVATNTEAVGDWTRYTFYVEVGFSSVSSLKLKLGLGYDDEISGEIAGMNKESSGIVLFDNVSLKKISAAEYNEAQVDATTSKLSYLTDGFDTASSTTDDQETLTTPTGWTGSADTNQSKSNTKAGVVHADITTLPVASPDSLDQANEIFKDLIIGDTVSLFGKTYKYATYEIKQDDIDAARADYEGKTDDEIKVILQKIKMYEDVKANNITPSELMKATAEVKDIIGSNFLVINNTAASAYYFTGPTYTLSAETAYEITVWVRTYNVTGAGASIQLNLGSAEETDEPFIFEEIKDAEWTKYTFYVQTLDDDVTSVKLKLKLGKYTEDNDTTLSSGYAMFDAITIKAIDGNDFDAAEENIPLNAKVRRIAESSKPGATDDDETDVEVPTEKFDVNQLWWMVPTIVLGLATIVAVVWFFIKKFHKGGKSQVVVASHEAIATKRSKYEDSNE